MRSSSTASFSLAIPLFRSRIVRLSVHWEDTPPRITVTGIVFDTDQQPVLGEFQNLTLLLRSAISLSITCCYCRLGPSFVPAHALHARPSRLTRLMYLIFPLPLSSVAPRLNGQPFRVPSSQSCIHHVFHAWSLPCRCSFVPNLVSDLKSNDPTDLTSRI